jgi:hypothetical protein
MKEIKKIEEEKKKCEEKIISFKKNYDIKTYITNKSKKYNNFIKQLTEEEETKIKKFIREVLFSGHNYIELNKCIIDNEIENIKKRLLIIDEKETKKNVDFEQLKCLYFNIKIKNGFDCMDKFITYINNGPQDTIYYFVSFNGANFDNYILYNKMLENPISKDKLSDPLLCKGQLLDFKYMGRHRCYDIRKHVVGSLAYNCSSFGIKIFNKVKGFDHYLFQQKYNNKELLEFIKNNNELKTYNLFDVLSLGVLFCKYNENIKNITFYSDELTTIKGDNVYKYSTLGMLANNIQNQILETKQIKLPLFHCDLKGNKYEKFKKTHKINLDIETYNLFLLKAYQSIKGNRVAGRVQLFNGVQTNIKGRIYSFDVCSLYPYVMAVAPNFYPAGEIIPTEKYERNKLGFYFCDIDQTNIKNNINLCPLKSKDGNIWERKPEVIKQDNVLISTVLMNTLKRNGAKVVPKNGFYFSSMVKGCELFSMILNLMKLKNGEDIKKKLKDETYNPAAREVYKLLSNILSGKINQSLNLDKREIIKIQKFINLIKAGKNVNPIAIFGEKIHVERKKQEEDCIKNAKAISVGAFIYDYAKTYMYENIYSMVPLEYLLYTDTDSCKMGEEGMKIWMEYAKTVNVPHWDEVLAFDNRYENHMLYNPTSKVYGSFEDEYAEKDINLSYFLQKKVYLCINDKYNEIKQKLINEGKTKEQQNEILDKYKSFHFKGVNPSNKIINYNEKQDNKLLSKIYNEENEFKRIEDDYIDCFEKLAVNKTLNLLTSNLTKSYNNTKKYNENEGLKGDRLNNICYHIKSLYNIKTIKII